MIIKFSVTLEADDIEGIEKKLSALYHDFLEKTYFPPEKIQGIRIIRTDMEQEILEKHWKSV